MTYIPLRSEDLPSWPDSQPLPVEVEHVGGYRLRVTFDDGEAGVLDMTRAMTRLDGPIVRFVRQPHVFRQAHVNEDDILAWPRMDPDDPMTAYDIAPDYLYVRCIYGDGQPFAEDKMAEYIFDSQNQTEAEA